MDTTTVNLRDVLGELYSSRDDQVRVAEEAGIPRAFIPVADTPINAWHKVVAEAKKRGKLQALVDVAAGEYPENEWLKQAGKGGLDTVRGPDIREDVRWKGPESADQLEKIIGPESTLLPVSFLEIGLQRARSVARIKRADGSSGTGFLTPGNILVTNHHVLPDESVAAAAVAELNYQATPDGLDAPKQEYALEPDRGFVTDVGDDWTVVRVAGSPEATWGALVLQDIKVKLGARVNIIQHPGGGPKQLAIYHNIVVYVGETRIQYLTDTLPGSSGSPVFDQQWRIVALHHSGGWLSEPDSKKTYYRNEGVSINSVRQGIDRAGLSDS